jgi:hypothetical protein
MFINLNFKENGMESGVRDPSNIVLTKNFLKKDAFVDYDADFGEIYIKNTTMFIKYLTGFSGDITLEKEEDYILKISNDSREAYIILASENVCENIYRGEEPSIESTAKIVFDSAELSRMVSDVKLLKINQVIINKEEDSFNLEVGVKGESDYFVNKIPFNEQLSSGVGKTSVGQAFLNLYEAVNGTVEFYIGNKLPLIVRNNTDKMTFTCLLAPIVEKE